LYVPPIASKKATVINILIQYREINNKNLSNKEKDFYIIFVLKFHKDHIYFTHKNFNCFWEIMLIYKK